MDPGDTRKQGVKEPNLYFSGGARSIIVWESVHSPTDSEFACASFCVSLPIAEGFNPPSHFLVRKPPLSMKILSFGFTEDGFTPRDRDIPSF